MSSGHPHAAGPHAYAGIVATTPSGSGYLPTPTAGTLSPPSNAPTPALFFALEMQTYRAATTVQSYALGHASAPHGAIAKLPQTLEYTGQVLASDIGYVGPGVYPPTLDTAFSMNAQISLDPHNPSGGYQYGTVKLTNVDRAYDDVAKSQNSDGRPFRILVGEKAFDATRGIYVDPAYSALVPFIGGVGQPWTIDDTALECPVRDATYWLEGNLQTTLFGGTGGYDGTAALAGQPKPKARGGTSANPIQNVTPVLIDPVALIYQYSDGPGTVVRLYEGADSTARPSTGDVADLYGGTAPASGYYRTCNARGMFQLGNKPAQAITVDITGAFPAAGAITTLFGIARYLMTEDMGLPATLLDVASMIGADAAFPYVAGVYYSGQVADGATEVGKVLASIGAQLVPTVAGTLRAFVLRALTTQRPVVALGLNNVLSVVAAALPDGLFPPTYRWRVGYGHNYTVQTSGFLGYAAPAHILQIAQSDQFASWYSAALLATYKRPTDPQPLPGALLLITDAQTVANALGALWGVRRRLFAVKVPLMIGVGRQIGDVVTLAWNQDDLDAGALGQIVGISFISSDPTVVLQVLI